jgi:hypothetical protein
MAGTRKSKRVLGEAADTEQPAKRSIRTPDASPGSAYRQCALPAIFEDILGGEAYFRALTLTP